MLVDPPADGAWNMAVDEALLEEVTTSGRPVLRFYQWQSPTLSLGYFQKVADRAMHAASSEAEVVRRLSGGGAILHDQELTYSFILPQSHPLADDTQLLYDCVHDAIVSDLNDRLRASSRDWTSLPCDEPSNLGPSEQPFLCFLRRAKGDILLRKNDAPSSENYKIVGSAQRRRRGTVLQHGSILLSQSSCAPELPGFNELTGQLLDAKELLLILSAKIAEKCSLTLRRGKRHERVLQRIQDLQTSKYECSSWTDRR